MKQDEFGAAIEQTLRNAQQPLTASEIRDEVGCSRQRVYTWLQANEHKLRAAGKDRSGGTMFVWAGKVRHVEPSTDSDADTMKVKSFFVDAGEIVLVLVGPDGSTYHARPAV
jgi:predicted transcriptional regulator